VLWVRRRGEGRGDERRLMRCRFVVCEYYPPGNVIGSFGENVQARVPVDEQPGGPGEPGGPGQELEGKECPQGGDCSSGVRRGVSLLAVAVWAAVWLL
jgi:hypothetical protein